MNSEKPSPISAWDESMLSVDVFDSTHTQGSSKYFLFTDIQKAMSIAKEKNLKMQLELT